MGCIAPECASSQTQTAGNPTDQMAQVLQQMHTKEKKWMEVGTSQPGDLLYLACILEKQQKNNFKNSFKTEIT